MWLLCCALALAADRVEIPVAVADQVSVVPAGEHGLALYIQRKGERNTYEIEGYGTDFARTWQTEIEVDKAMAQLASDADEDHAWVLLQRGLRRTATIRTDLETGYSSTVELDLDRKLYPSEHFVADGKGGAWLGAQSGRSGLLVHIDGDGKTSAIDVGKKKWVQGLTRGVDGTVQASVRNFKSKPGTPLEVLDLADGAIQSRRLVAPNDDVALIAGRSLALDGDDLVVGTWQPPGLVSGATGLFVAGFGDGGQTFFRSYRFDELEHFLDFLPDRREARIEKRVEKKKEAGKHLGVRWNLLIHDPIEVQGGVVLVAEAYFPVYVTQSRTVVVSDGRGGTTTQVQTYQVFVGWRFSHALMAAFDKQGGLLWDQSVPLQSKLTSVLRPHVRLHEEGGRVSLIYARKGVLRTAVLEGSTLVVEEETLGVADAGAQSEDTKNLVGDAAWWFDDTFLLYGVDRVKDQGEKKQRVFFFSRLEPASRAPKAE